MQKGPVKYHYSEHTGLHDHLKELLSKELRHLGYIYICIMRSHYFFRLPDSAYRVFDLTYWAGPDGLIRLYCPCAELRIWRGNADALQLTLTQTITGTVEQDTTLDKWENVPELLHIATARFHQLVTA